MWWPSLLSPQPSSQAAGASSSRCNSANDAPSPSDSPLRRASHGRQTSVLSNSSARKPYSVVMHSESQPPTTAASMTPSAINRAAARVRLGARGARGGDHPRRALEPERGLDETRERRGVVRLAKVQPGGQCAVGVALAVGDLGLQNARGAGAHQHADASGAVACHRAPHVFIETVAAQRQCREPVVAAVVARQRRWAGVDRRRRRPRQARRRALQSRRPAGAAR